jgi:hypothetical protein
VMTLAVTLQQKVRWGHVEPSPESERPELRIAQIPPRPDPRHVAICTMCERTRTVNGDGQCGTCWERFFVWVGPSNQGEAPQGPRGLAGNGALFDTSALWQRRPHLRTSTEWLVDYHDPGPPRTTPEWQYRPWQVHRWQSDDGRRHRNYRSRTAPERLHPIEDSGVWIRCLVCLRMTAALRHDQVCGACEKDWNRSGKPWGEDYEHWMMTRRARQTRRSDEHLADFDRAEFFVFVRGTFVASASLTSDVIKPIIKVWDNGICGEGDLAPSVISIHV